MKILVSGGTGFLGKQVVPLLQEFAEVHVISRSGATDLKGDLTQWNADLNIEDLIKKKFDVFLHLAGLYELTAEEDQCLLHNVVATSVALRLAASLEIPRFINASSIAVGINSPLPVVKPYDLHFSEAFPDHYAESKALAEKLLQNWTYYKQDEKWEPIKKIVNLRLGILVGDSQKGTIFRIDGPYHAPEGLEKVRFLFEKSFGPLPLPGEENRTLPLVPVDICAKAIVKFCKWSVKDEQQGYQSFQLTPDIGLSVRQLYQSALKRLQIKNHGFFLAENIPEPVIKQLSAWIVKFPKKELNYILKLPKFDNSTAVKILGKKWCPEFSEYESSFWSGYEEYISNRRN